MTHQPYRYVAQISLLAAAYFVAGRLGLQLATVQENVTLVWVPTGIALAAVLRYGYSVWPGLAAGAFLVNSSTSAPLEMALATAVGNPAQALVGAYLLRRVAGFHASLDRVQDVLAFVVLAAICSTAISATVGVTALWHSGMVQSTDYVRVWVYWWVGDAMGVLLVAPVLLAWAADSRVKWRSGRFAEMAGLAIALTAVSLFVFGVGGAEPRTELAYALFPFLVYATLRLSQRETVTLTLLVSSLAVWGTVLHFRSADGESLEAQLVYLHTYMGVAAVTALLLSAVLAERKRVLEVLGESETRLARTEAFSLVMVAHLGLDGRWLKVPPPLCELLGSTEQELLAGRFADVTHPDDIDADWTQHQRLIRGEVKSFDLEKRCIRKDAGTVWVYLNCSIVPDRDGRPVHLLAYIRDITQRKRAEEALQAERARYRHLFEHTPVAIWEEDLIALAEWMQQLRTREVIDLRAFLVDHPEELQRAVSLIRVLDVNQAALAQNGAKTKDQLTGELPALFTDPAYAAFIHALEGLWQGKTTVEYETSSRSLDGRRLNAIIQIAVARDGDRTDWSRAIVTATDITARKQAEDALQRRLVELTILNRIGVICSEAKSEDELIGHTTTLIAESLFPDNCGFLLLDATRGILVHHASFFISDPTVIRADIPLGNGITGQVARTGRPLRIGDVSKASGYLSVDSRSHSELCVPIKIATRVVGVLDVESQIPNAFTTDDEQLTTTIVGLVGNALERLRAEEAVQKRLAELSILNHVGQICSEAKTEDEVIRRITALIAESLFPDNCGFLLLDATRNVLVPHPSFVLTNPAVVSVDVPLGTGITGQVARTKQPLRVGDVTKAPGYMASDSRTQSELCVPIEVATRVVGVINVESRSLNAFSAADEQLMEIVGDLSGNALERLRAAAALGQSERRFRALIENSNDAITLNRPDGTVLYASPSVERVLGYTPEEMLGINPFTLIHPEDAAKLAARVGDAMATPGAAVTDEHRVRQKDGSWRWIEAAGTNMLADPDVGAIVGNLRDITERKQLEEQLLHSQKLDAIGRLAGGVAHDFNNLLTVINGYSDVILGTIHRSDPLHEMIEEIRKAGERAAGLTHQLLAFSRKQVLVPVVLNPNDLLANMGKMLKRLIGEDIELDVRLAPDLGLVKVDAGRIEQVILNLVVNARDAMPRGGRIIIETENTELDAAHIAKHPETLTGEYVVVIVTDTGCGMDAATKCRIFEPFFTTKEMDKGTGLGLATVYGIVKQSGGHVEVSSELGLGTTFRVYLPRVREATPSGKLNPGTAASHGGTETLLVVEDEHAVRLLACRVLEGSGYKVLRAQHGGEALLACEQYEGTIDLLVTDMVMPQMSGRQLAERLLTVRPGLKVLYMSGYTDDAVLRHGVGSDTPFIQKPFAPDVLARKVREVLDGA